MVQLKKVQSVVVFCTSSPNRYEKVKDACNYCRISITKKLQLNCKIKLEFMFKYVAKLLFYTKTHLLDWNTRLTKVKEKVKLLSIKSGKWQVTFDNLALFRI